MRTRLQKQEKGTGKYIFECIKTPNIYNFRFAIIHTKNNRIVSALINDCSSFSISQRFFLLYIPRAVIATEEVRKTEGTVRGIDTSLTSVCML